MATSPGTLLLGSRRRLAGTLPLAPELYYEAPVPGVFLQAGVELGIRPSHSCCLEHFK